MMNADRTLAPVSWERMIRAVEKVRERMMRAVQALEAARVPYAIAGGNAVAAWVSRVDETAVRNTRDVDILLRRSDLADARRALESAGFVHRRVANLGQPAGLDLFLDGPHAGARDALHVIFARENVRPDSPEPAPDVAESEPGDAFRLVTLEALARMKLTAFRDKDRMHLRDLIAVGLIDSSWPARLPGELARRLEALFDSPED
jgi:hypothetical protein